MNNTVAKTEILVVEDSSTQAERLRYILEGNGFRVSVANNGREALELLKDHGPSIVISDILMPEMDGYELCDSIKSDEKLGGTPVILLTALSDAKDVLRGLECGADNFITKPYDDEYLISKINYILTERAPSTSNRAESGVEVSLKGQKYHITAERQQIIDLLLSTYETAVRQNIELAKARDDLNTLNEQLEQKVDQRTAELKKEISERQKLNETLEQRVAERTEDLRKLAEDLKRSNTDLQQFAYAASHDLQEPLRTIASFVKLLEKHYKGKLDDRADEYIAYAVDGARRMQELIKDLLEYSRIGTKGGELRPTESGLVLDSVISSLQLSIKESGAAVTHDNMPIVTADAAQLGSLFQNLIGNALKFRGAEAPRVHISASRNNGEWVFSIRDNGIGIEPQFRDKIFVIFQRLHSMDEYPGTGIGLAICKKIVERHGGRIWVESVPDDGSIFYFTISDRSVQ